MNKPPPEDLMLDRRRERVEAVVSARTRSFTLVLDRVGDPHNLSAILRSAEAFGVQDIHVVIDPESGFRPNPKITQGCEKWVDIHLHATAADCLKELTAGGFQLFVSHFAPGAPPLHALPLEQKVALVLGNEVEGVGEEMLAATPGRFMIPMIGFSQSLNVSVAAAVCLSAMRERRRQLGQPGDLDDAERAALRQRFLRLALKQGKRLYRGEGKGLE